MANNENDKSNDIDRPPEQIENRIDPEREMPDADRVEQDRKEAEKVYGDQKDRKAS